MTKLFPVENWLGFYNKPASHLTNVQCMSSCQCNLFFSAPNGKHVFFSASTLSIRLQTLQYTKRYIIYGSGVNMWVLIAIFVPRHMSDRWNGCKTLMNGAQCWMYRLIKYCISMLQKKKHIQGQSIILGMFDKQIWII